MTTIKDPIRGNMTAAQFAATKNSFGLEKEKQIQNWLARTYDTHVVKSSKDDDILYDIDCWMGRTSISIKSQSICAHTGNLGFETYKMDTFTHEYDKAQLVKHPFLNVRGVWVPSWFYAGKAQYYVVAVVDDLYQVSKERLLEYVEQYGWDREASLSNKVLEEHANRRYKDYKNGLVALNKLLSKGIVRHIGVLS